MANLLTQLEETLLNQIQMLNDEPLTEQSAEEVKNTIEKSKAISDLTKNFMEIQRFKLDVVEMAEKNGITGNILDVELPKMISAK